PVANADKGQCPHERTVHAQATGDRKDEQAVSDRVMEGGGLGEFMIHVDRIEVAAEAGEIDDIRLRDGASRRLPFLADLHVIEILVMGGERHEAHPSCRSISSSRKFTETVWSAARLHTGMPV